MKHPKRKLTVAGAVLGILAVASPAFAITSQPPFTDNVVDEVHTAGSDTTFFVLNDLAKAYNESEGCTLTDVQFPLTPTSPAQNQCKPLTDQGTVVETENYDHDVLFNYFPQGSSAGRRQLCAQRPGRDPRVPLVNIARSSSAPADGFKCTVATGGQTGTTLRFIGFAKDALTWVHWFGNGVTNLTQAELNGIYVTCTITNWSQVGGADEPIRVWTAIPNSGTRASWDSFVGGNSANCIVPPLKDGDPDNGERVIREHRAQPVEEAINDPDAANEAWSIFPFSVGIHNTSPEARQNSILGNVNGVAPTEATIQDGTFPFSRLLYNVIRQLGTPNASAATRRFTNMSNNPDDQTIGWLCKPEQAHSEPPFTPGAGIETPAASKDYGPDVPKALRANGFVPLVPDTSTAARRCTFTDVPVT